MVSTAIDLGEALRRHGTIAVVHADADGRFAFWNEAAEAIFGYAAHEVLGQRIDLVVPHEYRDMHWAGFNRTIGSSWRAPTHGARSRLCTNPANASRSKCS